MSFLKSDRQVRVAGQATFGMSNLRSDDTGLPFIVFISQKDDARHAARVKWSQGPKVDSTLMGSYAVQPFGHKVGPRLDAKNERMLGRWIELNQDTLLKYWDGEIEYTLDAIRRLRPV